MLQSREKSAPPRFVDNAHDSEDSSELLEDLQEALLDYMVRSLTVTFLSILTRTVDGATNGDL